MKNLGEKIKELRIQKSMTIEQLAKKIGVAKSAISFWENNVNEPKASYIIELAKVFNVSTDYLLGTIDEYGNKLNENQEYIVPVVARSKRNTVKKHLEKLSSEDIDMLESIFQKLNSDK